MRLREIYMREAFQSFPEMAKRILHRTHKSDYQSETSMNCSKFCFFRLLLLIILFYYSIVNFDEPPVIADPWNIKIPEDLNCILKIEDGVIHVYKNKNDFDGKKRKNF